MRESDAPSVEETRLLCRKALKERQARKHSAPECLGGRIGCGQPGSNPDPQPEGEVGGREGQKC